MSITSINQAQGFDQSQYDMLVQIAGKKSVTANQVENAMLSAINGGASFAEALNQVSGQLPKLAPPNGADLAQLAQFGGAPSPGALVLSLITDMASKEREENRQLRWAQTESIVASMHDQANKMREQATIQLAMGITAGAVSIAGGLAQAKIAASGAGDTAQIMGTKAQGVGTAIGSVGGIFKSVGDFIGTTYQADIKKMDADQEKMRAMRDNLKDLDDSMKDLISKALSTMDSIQQNMNQTRTKILG
jgi:hypothetical protein